MPIHTNLHLIVAAQMWLLGRILPMLVGDYVPNDDEHWQNFLRLMEIVDYLFLPKVTENQVCVGTTILHLSYDDVSLLYPQITEDEDAYVASLISDHHSEFCELYAEHSVIPKMHFMVHMPRLTIQ